MVDREDTHQMHALAYQHVKRIWTEHRDRDHPAILAFGVDDSDPDNPVPLHADYAQGWDDVPVVLEYSYGDGAR